MAQSINEHEFCAIIMNAILEKVHEHCPEDKDLSVDDLNNIGSAFSLALCHFANSIDMPQKNFARHMDSIKILYSELRERKSKSDT